MTRLLGEARSLEAAIDPVTALVTRSGRPTPTRPAGRPATQHPSAADDQGLDPGTARRNAQPGNPMAPHSTCQPLNAADLRDRIKSIIVPEFGGIDHLPDSLRDLLAFNPK
jgi:hypothetical protein